MASTYSPNLRLELIGTGEQQGTWGITTNTNLGTLLEEAIGGYISVAVTDGADTTLTTNNGSADQSRNMVINLTGALTAARNVICPAIEKMYVVKNATTGGFAVTFKVSGQTGVSIPNGSTYILYVNGTDAVLATGTIAAQNSNNVSITGGSITGITDLAVADGGTGASTAAGAATNLGLGTGDSPQFAAVNIGNATDTTITRVSAGVIAVEGKTVVTETGGQTVQFAAGSNTAPSITTTGDTNTGIYFPAADTIAFTEGGAEAMRIDSAGNVGIGITSPTASLDVFGNIRTRSNILVGNTNGIQLGDDVASGFISYGYSSTRVNTAGHRWYNGLTTETMRIDATGQVGIGGAPSYALDVKATTGQVIVASTTGTNYARYLVANSGGTFQFGIDNSTGTNFGSGAAYSRAIFSDGAYPICVYTNGLERMRVDASGNVGIGTTPGQKLDVIGTIRSSSAVGVGDSSVNLSGTIVNESDTSKSISITADPGGVGANSFVGFKVDGTERMRVDSSGNVGIGTSTFGTSAATVLAIATGTAPSTGPADTIQIFSTDLSAGNTILSLRTEGTPVNANTTAAATHRIAVRINGTVYYLLANTAA